MRHSRRPTLHETGSGIYHDFYLVHRIPDTTGEHQTGERHPHLVARGLGPDRPNRNRQHARDACGRQNAKAHSRRTGDRQPRGGAAVHQEQQIGRRMAHSRSRDSRRASIRSACRQGAINTWILAYGNGSPWRMGTQRVVLSSPRFGPEHQTQFTVRLADGSSPASRYVTIDMPSGLEVATDDYSRKPLLVDGPYTANNVVGYQTSIRYQIRSICGFVMTPIRTNEYFTQNTRSTVLYSGAVNNWPFILLNPPPGSIYKSTWDVGEFNLDPQSQTYFFIDNLTQTDTQPGTLTPSPQVPPANSDALGGYLGTSPVWLIWQLQTFRVGSLTQGLGYIVQLGDLTFYLDHARVLPSPPQ